MSASAITSAGAVSGAEGKHTGLEVELAGAGAVQLAGVLNSHSDTTIYHTSHPGIVVKLFDLDCGKADEMAYGPYLTFKLELENWEDICGIEVLREHFPAYYGSGIDYEKKHAFIAMELLQGVNLHNWCDEQFAAEFDDDRILEFKEAIHQALSVVALLHRHDIIVLDFKLDNIMRMEGGGLKFVDLGAFFTPRHHSEVENYLYSTTPDYAEILIDSMNLQSGIHPGTASDIFAIGVALYEMVAHSSRLQMSNDTAREILANPSMFLFRDSQIHDMWKLYPHLKELLPPLSAQLRDGQILFAEFWHLLKAYLSAKQPDWDSLSADQRDPILLATGTTFIADQLPPQFQWLAGPVAQCTVLRNLRLKSIVDLMRLLANPITENHREDILQRNGLVQFLADQGESAGFVHELNTWQIHVNEQSGRTGIAAPLAFHKLSDRARFIYLRQSFVDSHEHGFYEVVDELSADDVDDGKLTLWHLQQDHRSWLGA